LFTPLRIHGVDPETGNPVLKSDRIQDNFDLLSSEIIRIDSKDQNQSASDTYNPQEVTGDLEVRVTQLESDVSDLQALSSEYIRKDGTVPFEGNQSMGGKALTDVDYISGKLDLHSILDFKLSAWGVERFIIDHLQSRLIGKLKLENYPNSALFSSIEMGDDGSLLLLNEFGVVKFDTNSNYQFFKNGSPIGFISDTGIQSVNSLTVKNEILSSGLYIDSFAAGSHLSLTSNGGGDLKLGVGSGPIDKGIIIRSSDRTVLLGDFSKLITKQDIEITNGGDLKVESALGGKVTITSSTLGEGSIAYNQTGINPGELSLLSDSGKFSFYDSTNNENILTLNDLWFSLIDRGFLVENGGIRLTSGLTQADIAIINKSGRMTLDIDTDEVSFGEMFLRRSLDDVWIESLTGLTLQVSADVNIRNRTLKVGDLVNNHYTEIDYLGRLKHYGDATVTDDLIGDVTRIKVVGVGINENTSENGVDFLTSANLSDYAYINYQVSHAWKLGSTLVPHIHFRQTSNAMPNFLIKWRWQRNGNSFSSGWNNLLCNTPVFSWIGSDMNRIATSAGITPPTGYGLSDIIQIQIFRDNSNASGLFSSADTHGDALVTGVDLHIEKDTLGSDTYFQK